MVDAAAVPQTRVLHGPRLAAAVSGIMLALLLPALDQTIVGVAMPHIVGSLGGFDRYSWVVTAYLLGSAALLPHQAIGAGIFGIAYLRLLGQLFGAAMVGSFLHSAEPHLATSLQHGFLAVAVVAGLMALVAALGRDARVAATG